MTPREYGEILARLDLMPRINMLIFGDIARIMIDFVEHGDKALCEEAIGYLENIERS